MRGWDFRNPLTLLWVLTGIAFSLIVVGTKGWDSARWYLLEYSFLAMLAASPPMTRRAARGREKRARRKAESAGPPFETARDRDDWA
jgi:hypothetical protein